MSRWGLGVMKQRRSSALQFNHTADYETDWSQNKQLISHRNERNGVHQMFQYSDHSGDDNLDKDDDDLRGGARGGGWGGGGGGGQELLQDTEEGGREMGLGLGGVEGEKRRHTNLFYSPPPLPRSITHPSKHCPTFAIH